MMKFTCFVYHPPGKYFTTQFATRMSERTLKVNTENNYPLHELFGQYKEN
jgi:hypothetical protein